MIGNMLRRAISAMLAVILGAVCYPGLAAMKGHSMAAKQSLLPGCQSPSALPSPNCGRTPTAVFNSDGHLLVVFSQNGHIYFTSSVDRGETFLPPVAVNRIPEAIYDDGENRPKLAIGKKDEIFISWTHKTPGRYSGDVRFSRSLDAGKNFDTPITINSNRDLISHRFDNLTVDADGRVFIIWIDKRDKEAANLANLEYAGVSLYYVFSQDQGSSFSPNRKLVDHSCECCRIATDVDESGQIVALWRHVYPVNIRDHAITRVGPETLAISGQPVRATDDDWMIEGCPHHGPDLAMDSQDKSHLFWFSKGKKNRGLTYGRFNLESSEMELQHSIDSSPSAARPQVEIMGKKVHLLWKRFNGVSTELLTINSSDAGKTWSEPLALAVTANGSDHPLLIKENSRLFVSWHTQSEGYRLIPLPNPQ